MEALARDYLKRAKARLVTAEEAFKRGYYPETVRYSQECVELSLKARLRMVGNVWNRGGGKTAGRIVRRRGAEEALRNAKQVHQLARKLIEEKE